VSLFSGAGRKMQLFNSAQLAIIASLAFVALSFAKQQPERSMKIAEIDAAARRQQTLEGGSVLSLPIPVKRNQSTLLLYIYYGYKPKISDGEFSLLIYRPASVLATEWPLASSFQKKDILDNLSKKFIDGLSKEELIGESYTSKIENKTGEEENKELFELYDVLVPEFFRDNTVTSDSLKSQALRFRHLFNRQCQLPLLPYYNEMGGDFFKWVTELSTAALPRFR
jgi:hypothetical protein